MSQELDRSPLPSDGPRHRGPDRSGAVTARLEGHLPKLWWVLAVGALVALAFGAVAQMRGPVRPTSAPQVPAKLDLGVVDGPTPNPAVPPGASGAPSQLTPSPTASGPSPAATRTSSPVLSRSPAAPPLPVLTRAPLRTAVGRITGINALCVGVRSGASSDGTTIQVLGCTGQPSQQWEVRPDGTLRTFGKCMTVSDRTIDGHQPIELWTCTGSSAQKWQRGSGTTLVNTGTGECLDDPYVKIRPGQELYAWRCDGTATQSWNLPA